MPRSQPRLDLIADAASRYGNRKTSIRAPAQEYSVARKTMKRWLQDAGLSAHRSPYPPKRVWKTTVRLASIRDLAAAHGDSYGGVRDVLPDNGVTLRGRGQPPTRSAPSMLMHRPERGTPVGSAQRQPLLTTGSTRRQRRRLCGPVLLATAPAPLASGTAASAALLHAPVPSTALGRLPDGLHVISALVCAVWLAAVVMDRLVTHPVRCSLACALAAGSVLTHLIAAWQQAPSSLVQAASDLQYALVVVWLTAELVRRDADLTPTVVLTGAHSGRDIA